MTGAHIWCYCLASEVSSAKLNHTLFRQSWLVRVLWHQLRVLSYANAAAGTALRSSSTNTRLFSE
jgi:hypothetical protein